MKPPILARHCLIHYVHIVRTLAPDEMGSIAEDAVSFFITAPGWLGSGGKSQRLVSLR
jgi:hypothetical protein